MNGVGQNRETDEEHDQDCVEEGFQLARVRDEEGGREALIVSICEMDQNWIAVHILNAIFQYFYYLVFRINRFLSCLMFYID